MQIFLLKDDDPIGGYYAAVDQKPTMSRERPSIVEVRAIEIEESLWEKTLAGHLIIDNDGSNDSTWAPLWSQGIPVWIR